MPCGPAVKVGAGAGIDQSAIVHDGAIAGTS